MKTVHSLFLTLFVAASLSSPIAWAGEPNPDALSGQPKKDQSKRVAGGDCSAEMAREVVGPDAAILLE